METAAVTAAQALVLGIIQGITEWLPVSSSGHLALAQQLMGVLPPVEFDIALHVGTLASVIVYYRVRLLRMLAAALKLDFASEDGRLIPLIIIAGIPTAIIGLAFQDYFEAMFGSAKMIGAALILTGCALYLTKYFSGKKPLSAPSALAVGIAQGLAVAPGISRSGWTMSAAMLLGVEKEKAADFSFILSIPTLIAAAALKARDASAAGMDFGTLAIGVIAAGIVGYAGIAVLVQVVKQNGFHWFALYCWLVGAAAIMFMG